MLCYVAEHVPANPTCREQCMQYLRALQAEVIKVATLTWRQWQGNFYHSLGESVFEAFNQACKYLHYCGGHNQTHVSPIFIERAGDQGRWADFLPSVESAVKCLFPSPNYYLGDSQLQHRVCCCLYLDWLLIMRPLIDLDAGIQIQGSGCREWLLLAALLAWLSVCPHALLLSTDLPRSSSWQPSVAQHAYLLVLGCHMRLLFQMPHLHGQHALDQNILKVTCATQSVCTQQALCCLRQCKIERVVFNARNTLISASLSLLTAVTSARSQIFFSRCTQLHPSRASDMAVLPHWITSTLCCQIPSCNADGTALLTSANPAADCNVCAIFC